MTRARSILLTALLALIPATGCSLPAPDISHPPASVSPTPAAPTPTPTPTPSPLPPSEPFTVSRLAITSVTPNSGTYGVGMPVIVTFSTDVPHRDRAALENLFTVTSTSAIPAAAWSWTTARTVTLRPRTFWPANTTITVRTRIAHHNLINTARKHLTRLSGGTTTTLRFLHAVITRIDATTKQAVVYRDGTPVRHMATSLGKPGWETRSGIKIVHEKYPVRRMTSQAVGDTTQQYDLQVPYAVRLTFSGEFAHGAPWATSRLGRVNGSHGCTNLSVPDARWFYTHTRMGDPVITRHTGRPMEPGNGWGGPWNVHWDVWLTQSATGAHAYGPPPPALDPTRPTSLLPTELAPAEYPAAAPIAPTG